MATEDCGRELIFGTKGEFQCVSVRWDFYMHSFLELCPEVVAGRYLAVTSHDSGYFRLTEDEVQAGWRSEGGIAYSPRVQTLIGLRYQRDGLDTPGFDEWYVFDETPPSLGDIYEGNYFEYTPERGGLLVFVNWLALLLPELKYEVPDLLESFWRQVGAVMPVSYLADGYEALCFASRDCELFASVAEKLRVAAAMTGRP